jgi:uncharacterized protein (TIGR00730 family)
VKSLRHLCVFCGSNRGNNPAYEAAAQQLGAELASRGITLVYGGGNVGLMGILADATLHAGGKAIGVIPEALMAREVGHRGLTELHVVKTMHERKALMAELSDGFIALPGGIGTFEEFFEVLTWAQLGIHNKPCALLNVAGFFDPLLQMIEHTVAEGFLRASHRSHMVVASEIAALIEAITHHHSAREHKRLAKETI